MSYFLGVDIGTGSIKLGLLSEEGRLVYLDKMEHSLIYPKEGWVEVSMEALWHNFTKLLQNMKGAGVAFGEIKGVSFSSFCISVLPFSKDSKPLCNPIIFMDARSKKQAIQIEQKIGFEKIYDITQNRMQPGAIGLTTMKWLEQEKPELIRQLDQWGTMISYFQHKLTGNRAIDPTQASYTGLFDVRYRCWSDELCQMMEISKDTLLPLMESYDIVGKVTEQASLELGLGRGIPVACGGADTACSALGLGVIEDRSYFKSSGTTEVLTVCLDGYSFDPTFLTRCHILPDKWLHHGAMSTAGASIRWYYEQFFAEACSYDQLMTELSERTHPGASGLLFLPYLAGERTPHWDAQAKGAFVGLTLNSDKYQMFRAVLEGCCYPMKDILTRAETLLQERMDQIPNIGGGVNSPFWCQLNADILNRQMLAYEGETAVMGAAMLAAVGTGHLQLHQVKEWTAAIRKLGHYHPSGDYDYSPMQSIFDSLYGQLKQTFKDLDKVQELK